MNPEIAFAFPLDGGLHARPAAALRARALDHDAPCEWINDRTGRSASLGNLLSLLGTDTRKGDPCRIKASGPGAHAALADLERFIPGEFLESDTPLEAPPRKGGATTAIRNILARAGCDCWEGIPLAGGTGTGPAVVARPAWEGVDLSPCEDPRLEREALRRALARAGAALRAAAPGHPARNTILEAQAAMLQDATWVEAMDEGIGRGLKAPAAVVQALEEAQAGLQASTNPYLRERALDLRDLGERLLAELTGAAPNVLELSVPCVLVASDLTPGRLLALDRALVRGLVLAEGAATSHTAILARSFGIPCVVCPEAGGATPGQEITVDGDRGLVIPDPPPALAAYYAIQAWERAHLQPGGDGLTADGVPIALHANILSPSEAEGAFRLGAQGIGLFRSEMLFMDRPEPPPEEEQYQAYRKVLEEARGKPVVLRLLDVGGDKPLSYLPLPREANPFLGQRGVRWYGLHPEVVQTQIAAAARAARHGDLRLMIPMVSEVEEIQAVRALVAQATDRPLPLGIMVEVPAAALNLPALAREADFLCVGTNDLVQYLFASDRSDAQVARPSHDWHPATLRILARIVEEAGRPLSLCGEMAGRPALLPLLLGLGFRSLSMAPSLLPEARRALAALDSRHCRALVEKARGLGSASDVEALLQTGNVRGGTLMDPELVVLDPPCATKEEAILLLSERLAAVGRARNPGAVEEAIWAREATYPTGVGFGFAVPHCKSNAVDVASLAVLRARSPLEWGSLDGQPVDFMVLLATPAGDGGQEHLRVFARLARKLMDETFRDALRCAPDSKAILDVLLPLL